MAGVLVSLGLITVVGCSGVVPTGGLASTISIFATTPISANVNACAQPKTLFARFWFITTGNDPGVYQGSVHLGTVTVPAMSIFVSGAAPGSGVLCVSDQAASPTPIQSVTGARTGAIGYLGDARGILYFATRPGIATATVDDAGRVNTYALDRTGEIQLQPLGGGWHAVGTGFGTTSHAVTVRAYTAAGQLVDTATHTMTNPPVSSSQPPPTR